MSKSYSSYLNQQQTFDRLLRLELTLAVLIREEVSGSMQPYVRTALLEFADQIRDENNGRPE